MVDKWPACEVSCIIMCWSFCSSFQRTHIRWKIWFILQTPTLGFPWAESGLLTHSPDDRRSTCSGLKTHKEARASHSCPKIQTLLKLGSSFKANIVSYLKSNSLFKDYYVFTSTFIYTTHFLTNSLRVLSVFMITLLWGLPKSFIQLYCEDIVNFQESAL